MSGAGVAIWAPVRFVDLGQRGSAVVVHGKGVVEELAPSGAFRTISPPSAVCVTPIGITPIWNREGKPTDLLVSDADFRRCPPWIVDETDRRSTPQEAFGIEPGSVLPPEPMTVSISGAEDRVVATTSRGGLVTVQLLHSGAEGAWGRYSWSFDTASYVGPSNTNAVLLDQLVSYQGRSYLFAQAGGFFRGYELDSHEENLEVPETLIHLKPFERFEHLYGLGSSDQCTEFGVGIGIAPTASNNTNRESYVMAMADGPTYRLWRVPVDGRIITQRPMKIDGQSVLVLVVERGDKHTLVAFGGHPCLMQGRVLVEQEVSFPLRRFEKMMDDGVRFVGPEVLGTELLVRPLGPRRVSVAGYDGVTLISYEVDLALGTVSTRTSAGGEQ